MAKKKTSKKKSDKSTPLLSRPYMKWMLVIGDTLYAYIKDHQGNVRAVINQTGRVAEVNHYYPYGILMTMPAMMNELPPNDYQPYKYGTKELNRENGLDLYDSYARWYDPALPGTTTQDPYSERYYPISPYTWCAANPVINVDPTGKSTKVVSFVNNKYEIIGGNLNDNDRNIYVYSEDRKGNYTLKGRSIGVSTSITSFYNSDDQLWQVGSKIDLNDNRGKRFLSKMASANVTLDDYLKKATTGSAYDFKVTNGNSKAIPGIDIYRGMPIGGTTIDGKLLISSARDIGNMSAGIVAAKNGITWKAARIAFDTYQSINNIGRGLHPGKEGLSTQNAELYGWRLMALHSNTHSELSNVWN